MASKSGKKLKTEAVAEAVEKALDIEVSFDDLDEASLGNLADDGDALFNELEEKLAAAASELRDAEESQNTRQAESAAKGGGSAKSGAGANASAEKQTATPSSRLPVSDKPRDRQGSANPYLVPANDETRNAVSELVYSLQKKPSRLPLVIAALCSALWLALLWYYVRTNEPGLLAAETPLLARLSDPKSYVYAGLAIIPVMMMWAYATLLRRAQEMRQAAGSMTEAAIRLMQPESIASDSIRSVGSAIRREVAAMSDGVERALARAGQLESMVQNEVLNLQRSYSDSEIRLRTLLTDISK